MPLKVHKNWDAHSCLSLYWLVNIILLMCNSGIVYCAQNGSSVVLLSAAESACEASEAVWVEEAKVFISNKIFTAVSFLS